MVPHLPTILNFPSPPQLLAPLLWKVGGPAGWLGRLSAPIFYLSIRQLTPRQLSCLLGYLGRREEALAASQEAIDVRRRLVQSRPDAFLPDLATSLSNISVDLSNLGRREEAPAIYRRLAEIRPDVFLPDLAMSLGVVGQALSQSGRHLDAAGAFREGLVVIAPFVERHADAYGRLASALGRDCARTNEMVGTPPDTTLIERVARALGGEANSDDTSIDAFKGKIEAIVDVAEKTSALDESAPRELPPDLAG